MQELNPNKTLFLFIVLLLAALDIVSQEKIPIMAINTSCNSRQYAVCTIAYLDNGKISHYRGKIKIRGRSSVNYPKKSYKMKIVDTDGEPLSVSFGGDMREDDSWILDAMYYDHSRMRNRVSFDIWNDFAVRPYYASEDRDMPRMPRGRFIELYLNYKYAGLYHLMEPIDRKQLDLKKVKNGRARGILYKTSENQPSVFMEAVPEEWDAESLVNDGVEMKYPDEEDNLASYPWEPLYDFIEWASDKYAKRHTSKADYSDVCIHADMPLWVDYIIYNYLTLNCDYAWNHYLYFRDIKEDSVLCIAPWDNDMTWGLT